MREKSKVRAMYILDGGSFLYEMGMMTFGQNLEEHLRIFTPFYAFDTEEGWILYDTGWPAEAPALLEQLGMDPQITAENSALEQLKKIGVSASDISKVIVSHLHVDHTGGLRDLAGIEVLVQKDEHAYAQHPNSFNATAYLAFTFDSPEINWNLLEGDGAVIPGLTVMLANGHTPGLQGLIVELPESGFFLLGADSAYLKTNIENDIPPGNSWNPILAQYSIRRFKAIAELLDGQFFPGHDNDFFSNEVKLATAYQ
jgi:N-acyl homoserine lactone hydrolase